ncbi:hypothetical protein BTJ44_00984 [Bacillus mycoides]|nr:hypothetical protein BTJ44_00984 [Bacillus mycoides]
MVKVTLSISSQLMNMVLVEEGVITSSSTNTTAQIVGKNNEKVAGPIICPDLVAIVTTVPVGHEENKKQAKPLHSAILSPPNFKC